MTSFGPDADSTHRDVLERRRGGMIRTSSCPMRGMALRLSPTQLLAASLLALRLSVFSFVGKEKEPRFLSLALALPFFSRREGWELLSTERLSGVHHLTLSGGLEWAFPSVTARGRPGAGPAHASARAALLTARSAGNCNGSSPVATVGNCDVSAGSWECMHCARLGSFSTVFLHIYDK
jgi:hypothetical protein